MKLKTSSMQELYDKISTGSYSFTVYEDSPIESAFRKCDDELFAFFLKADRNMERANKEIEKLRREVSTKDKRNNELQKQLLEQAGHTDRDLEKEIERLRSSRLDWAKRACDRRKERDDARLECENLKNCLDRVTKADARDHLRAELEAKVDRLDEITKALDDAKKQLNYFTNSRDTWRSRAKYAEDEIEALKKDNKDLEKQLGELTSQYQKLTIENKRLQNSVHAGYDQGQTDLWVKLQNVNNSQPFELATCFPDVTGVEYILSWDLEDFLDAYKKWQEEKETDRMRNWLIDFCYERECKGCPLESKEYKCGCGYSFRMTDPSDLRIIPDKDIKRYYEKARGCGRYTLSNDISEKIKDAENKMNKWLMNMDSWECTLEGTIEINKDLLEKVCGVKPDEESHKLEYGDAVRLTWRDYDYMYIGPDEKEGSLVRMFDPKNHAIVTSHIANVRYNGGKIILTSEEDLRKIWKDTK